MNDVTMNDNNRRKGFSGKQVFIIVLLTLLVAIVLTYFVLQKFVFGSEFKPVNLSQNETVVLNEKLQALGFQPDTTVASNEPQKKGFWGVGSRSKNNETQGQNNEGTNTQGESDSEGETDPDLIPEPYKEDASKREIFFTERELNGMLAKNTDMEKRLAIDLADDLASAKMIIPMDPDFPFVGGKKVRINTGVGLSFTDDRPVVVLKGVSVMGVPIPNAWLGNLKNVDLVSEFGLESGFWKTFAAGVEYINVEDGKLHIKLKE